jgi:Protein of unknown function (DUF1569)
MKRYTQKELLKKFVDPASVMDWADHLLDVGYEPRLKWNLGQVCRHLAMTLEMSRRGFPEMKVPLALKLSRPVLRVFLLGLGRMPAGVPTVPMLDPGEVGYDSDGLRVLKRETEQFQQLADDRKMPASPLLGRMTKAQWERLHLVHAAHHFRWLAEK